MTMNGYTIGKPEEEGFLSSSEGRNWDWGWGAPRVDPRSGSFPYEVAARASPPHSASLPCDLLKVLIFLCFFFGLLHSYILKKGWNSMYADNEKG